MPRPITRRTALAVPLLAVPLLSAARAAGGLKLAFIPQENPEKLLADIALITAWLTKRTGLPIEGFVTIDHAAAVEALRNGDADISFMGALPFVLAEAQIGALPLLSEIYRGATSYRGRVFVRRDSGISTLADLRGKTIAFADPISESGYLFPLDLFVQAGLVEGAAGAEAFFARVFFAGGYQQAMQAMAEGLVDAAGASQYADLLLTPDQQQAVTWIAESVPIPSHLVVARPGLDEDVLQTFTRAMIGLNTGEDAARVQRLFGHEGFAAADPATLETVRAIARRYGLLS